MKSLNWAELMFAGGLAGVTAWLVSDVAAFETDVDDCRSLSLRTSSKPECSQ